jgi:shikimate kinase
MQAMKLVLIGLRGSGKTTVGRLLAERLNWPFDDTDVLIQARAKLSIREIFEKLGEARFRQIEAEVVQECARQDQVVIATGGGAVLDPKNVIALRSNGLVVHLTASPAELWRRVSADKTSADSRPKLLAETASGQAELEKLMRLRASAYERARHTEISAESCGPDEVASRIMKLLAAHTSGIK